MADTKMAHLIKTANSNMEYQEVYGQVNRRTLHTPKKNDYLTLLAFCAKVTRLRLVHETLHTCVHAP